VIATPAISTAVIQAIDDAMGRRTAHHFEIMLIDASGEKGDRASVAARTTNSFVAELLSAKETLSEMGVSAAGRFKLLLCGLYLQGLSFSIVVARSSRYDRADNQDWQQTQDDCPNDEGRDQKDVLSP
jgi:hypothetical protein